MKDIKFIALGMDTMLDSLASMLPPHKVGNDVIDDEPILPKRQRLRFESEDSEDDDMDQNENEFPQNTENKPMTGIDLSLMEKAVIFLIIQFNILKDRGETCYFSVARYTHWENFNQRPATSRVGQCKGDLIR